MTVQHGTKGADVLLGALNEANELWGHREGDVLIGGKLEDLLIGGKGDDVLWGDKGDDTRRAQQATEGAYIVKLYAIYPGELVTQNFHLMIKSQVRTVGRKKSKLTHRKMRVFMFLYRETVSAGSHEVCTMYHVSTIYRNDDGIATVHHKLHRGHCLP